MMLNVFVIENRLVKAFERPIFTQDSNEEFIERIQRDFRASDDNAKARMLECVVYEVGVYDDNTGKITVHDPLQIFDIGTLKEVQKNEN